MEKALISIISKILSNIIYWAIICVEVWLVTKCFDWYFDLKIATGVWLITDILKQCFVINVYGKEK